MQVTLAAVTPRKVKLKAAPAQALVAEYVERARRYTPVEVRTYDTEAELLAAAERGTGRSAAHLVLLESRGKSLTSEGIAAHLERVRDAGTQRLLLAIGPADGWTAAALSRADLRLSLGAITLPHELAQVVAAEQLYRALTILAGHPYHSGH